MQPTSIASHARGLPKVLIVDDDPVFTTMASSCLAATAFQPSIAGDGVEAIEMLETQPFDAALIDLAMPRVDGFRLISLIRNTPRLRRLGIMVISSSRDAEAFEEALALGANAFLTKPVNWPLLPVQVRYVLKAFATA